MPNLRFLWNSVPKFILRAEAHRLVPKLFRAEVTRVEHRLPRAEYFFIGHCADLKFNDV